MTDLLAKIVIDQVGHLQAERGIHADKLARSHVARIARRAHKSFRQLHERKELTEARDRLRARARLYRKKAA